MSRVLIMRTEKNEDHKNNVVRLIMSVTAFCVRGRLIGRGENDSKTELKENDHKLAFGGITNAFDKSCNVLRDVQ